MKHRYLFLLYAGLFISSSAVGVTVECQTDVSDVAADDTLQDVLPTVNEKYQGMLLAGLVDGGSRDTVNLMGEGKPGNGTAFHTVYGPVWITWDLGTPEKGKTACLESLVVWLYAGNGRNFHGQWSVSKDGKHFKVIPETLIKKEFPAGKKASELMHAIRYVFSPDEVTGFRYLRLELLEFPGQCTQIQEVDGVIRNVQPGKYTEIHTTIQTVKPDRLKQPYPDDQTVTPPMKVQPLSFCGMNLALVDQGKTILDLTGVLDAADGWRVLDRKSTSKEIVVRSQRKDGLIRENRATIDSENRLVIQIAVELPESASNAVEYDETTLKFLQGQVVFDGITYGSGCGPIFIPRSQATMTDVGERAPYYIFPCKEENIELQLFMPGWYNRYGRFLGFKDDVPAQMTLYTAVKPGETQKGRWYNIPGSIAPSERLSYTFHLAVFSQTPATLGQKDIESGGLFNPLIGIEAGTGNQQVQGSPRVLQRDKMLFMGFIMPPATTKPGHQLQIEPYMDIKPVLDRFAQSGVGLLTLMGDYRDVSHGVSYEGDYEKCPPGYPELLQQIHHRGMKALGWFSPRGFLQKDWGTIPKDKLVEQHPDWFTEESHWFGFYRTVDVFNPAPSEWCEAKMKKDLEIYPDLMGFAYDTFPGGRLTVSPKDGKAAFWSEMEWLKRFTSAIRSFGPEKVVLSNGTVPLYDDYQYYDYTVSEHPLLMFLNDVTAGRMPFGHTYVPWEQFGQLYYWFTPLGHLYYNFCDYDQGVAWVGPNWIGMMPGQMEKEYESEVAPLWRLMGLGHRIYGAQIAPNVRQIEARSPDGEEIMLICSMSSKPTSLTVRPQKIKPLKYQVSASVDTAKKHIQVKPFDVDLSDGSGFEVKDIPPYSIVTFHFSANDK